MLNDIERHISLIDKSIKWAKDFHKENFPQEVFKEYRRKLRRINSALEEKCSVAAYGESQVGKSYLMSSLLSSPSSPFVICSAGKEYSFIDEINPSGGNHAKIESTGIITRFTLSEDDRTNDLIKVHNLSVADLILLLTDAYYNDIRINPENVLKYDEINKELDRLSELWSVKSIQQNDLTEDDVKDIYDYIHDILGNSAVAISQSNFCRKVAPMIKYVSYDKWVDIFSLLWNRNKELSHLFNVLINEYKKLNFKTEIFIPFKSVLRKYGTLLKIEWLDTVCGVNIETGNDIVFTDIYDEKGNIITRDFNKGSLSALVAELTFVIPKALANERRFLHKMDLLDFPGARSREKFKEGDIHTVLPKILRRGKVAYLFNKYSRSLRISSVLFCHHNDQKAEATIGETINSWIEDNIGKTPEERTEMLKDTNGIAPLFFIATKFNIDLERTKIDTPSNIDNLSKHWNRFDTVFPEIIKPNKWLDEWVVEGGIFKTTFFQNIYPLRDFYWSSKNQVFDGYCDGRIKSAEKSLHYFEDYPNYFKDLKDSFLRNEFVRKHFANPDDTWNDVATVGNDGSKAIIKNLDSIADVLESARDKRYHSQLCTIKDDMLHALSVYYEPENLEAKNLKVKQIAGDIRLSLTLSVGEKPEVFGHIIDLLMIPVGDVREIAYNIIVCHTEEPVDFSKINFIRQQADIDSSLDNEAKKKKLCNYLMCDENQIEEKLEKHGCTLDEVLNDNSKTLTTVADVVTKYIMDYWIDFINNRTKLLETMLPHAAEVVYMFTALAEKLDIRKSISDKINQYCNTFSVNEQPNVIADYASLTLNNFVSTVGRGYMSEQEAAMLKNKAEICGVQVNMERAAWKVVNKRQSLIDTLKALEVSTDISHVGRDALEKLPFWNNFQRWQNLVMIGLLYSSDISHVDPEANMRVKVIIDEIYNLYK